MPRKPSAKKLSLITALAVFILISIAVAVQSPSKAERSNIADVNILQESSSNSGQAVAENGEPIGKDTNTPVIEEKPETGAKVTEKPEIAVKPSSENTVQDTRSDTNVSRGTNTITNPVNNTTPNDSANFWQNRKTWLQPVKGKQTSDPTGGARYFGAARSDGRIHAAIDFIAPGGTPVYAMTDGKVVRTSLFFQNTSAVEVQNTDGTIARYCEISPSVSVGTTVHRGDLIGKIMTNNAGTAMLHLEMYMGTSTGSLSQSSNSSNYKYVKARNYERRSDLIDPTGAIYLPVK
jgi:murein DD-endopeptidase MepM/ murein hydrolase activator NlpD